jgi:hypothetical protein
MNECMWRKKMNVEKDECGDKKRVERKMNVESNCVGKCCGGFFSPGKKGLVCFWWFGLD